MPKSRKILIVDDSAINRQLLTKILSDSYTVIEANNGSEALKILYDTYESISAVLLDIIMPEMNGYEMLEEVRRSAFLSKVPILVTTESDDQEAELKALSLGACDFLVKPYKPAVILHRLANTIQLREASAIVNVVEKDQLTGVYIKEFFYKKVTKKIKENPDKKYDILCMDIERFKLINDLFGIYAGDELLIHIVNLAKEYIKEAGIIGRVGADKFAFLLPHRDNYDNAFFKKFLEEINRFPININIKACYGIYCIDDPTIPINVMCDRALIASSSIKGKYDVHFAYYSDEFRQVMLSEQLIMNSMKTALAEKQFEVYYQPKYDLSNDAIAGAEALVRWNHPQKGFMAPGSFIPLFERNGFIIDLDIYVWNAVCEQIRNWIDAGITITPISVNVSRTDIYNPKLIQILKGLINKYELKPEYLHLEITESAYTENPEQLIGTIQELRKLGFIIEMDDFGTGYSSLNMLSELPIHILKIDMKFIQNETAKGSHKNILSFIISLAKWLNLKVVAEGVETSDQAKILKSMDCNYGQGFYFAKPLPKNNFTNLLKQPKSKTPLKTSYHATSDTINIQKSSSDRVMMIVDDSEINRKILSAIFRNLYNIVEAANGQVAYDYIKQNYTEIDIILLDLVMPVMDGFQVLEKLKVDEKLNNIPVIITSQPSEDIETRALSMGAADFISKPYNKEVALRRVSYVMAQYKLSTLEREKELARKVKEMRFKAEHDCLTSLYNRAALENAVNTFFANHALGACSFFMMDLDHFKSINDTFGHDKGDELLIHVSKIIQNAFLNKGYVARLGGDEFAVFLPTQIPNDTLIAKANELCKQLQLHIYDIEISASIGIASAPDHGFDYQTLYKHADFALLAAKRLGKNQYIFYDNEMEMPSIGLYQNMEWLLDEIGEAIVICDPENYEILYLNQVAATLAEKSKQDCIGKKCFNTLWKRENPCHHCISGYKLTTDYIEQEVEDTVHNRHYIIRDKLMEWNGKKARIQYILDDTSNFQYKQELLFTNEQFANILSTSQSAHMRFILDDAWTIMNANHKFYEIIGYTQAEFKAKNNQSFLSILDPDYLNKHKAQLIQTLQDTSKALMKTEFIKANNERILMSTQIFLKQESDGKTYCYASCIVS